MQGSRNAFAVPGSSHERQPGVLSEQDGNARAPKRPRLSEDAVAAIHTQCADPETALEVDHMMLDYLAYQAINTCLASRSPDPQEHSNMSLSKSVALADTFIALFKERHPAYTADPELRFRIKLLKLVTLFTQRFTKNPTTPSEDDLKGLRSNNRARARRWTNAMGQSPTADLPTLSLLQSRPLSNEDLERNRAHVLHQLGVPPEDEQYEDAFYGTNSSVSLLDLLPSFMQVSSIRIAMSSSNLTERWMHLAGEFMLQAVLERTLVFGSEGLVDEAFSWGYRGDFQSDKIEAGGQARDCGEEINAMFEDDEFAVEVEGWKTVKTSYLQLLQPLDGAAGNNNVVAHLEKVATDHPLSTFETSLHRFLAGLSGSVPAPVLVQLERGKLGDLSEAATKDFLRDCGIGAAQFFEAPVGFKSALDR